MVVLFVFCSALLSLFHNAFLRLCKTPTAAALFLALVLAPSGSWATAYAGTNSATTTTLAVTSGGSAATSVAAGSVVTLTASVLSGATKVTVGQVNFCDASVTYCTDIHLLGTAQLTAAGTAVLKVRPGIGSHSYKAVFAGTHGEASSTSSALGVTITGRHATTTTIAQVGIPGDYELTATVAGITNVTGISAPTGSVSFVDTSNSNFVLGTATVSAGTVGLSFANSLAPTTVPAGMGIATADFNGDGIADLAVGAANVDTTSLSILLGNGDGTFTATPANPVVGNYPYSVMVGDFNSDGIPDLAVGNVDDNTVTILLGKGDGTFTAQPSLNLSDSPQALATADFNGDGIPDLAIVLRTAVLIFDGNGDGTFHQIADVLGPKGPLTEGIAIGDLNGDGVSDIVVANDAGNASVTVFLGKFDGTFTGGTEFGSGSTGISVAMADFNRDGILDLAVTSYDDFSVSILLGNGDGTFQTPVPYRVPLVSLQSVTVADFNGDGVADLAVGSGYPGSVAVLPGNGDGTFGAPVLGTSASFFYPSGNLAVADFNGDGLPDIAEPDQTSSNMAVFLNQQSESVTATLNNVNPSGPGPHMVQATYPGDSNFTASVSATTSLTAVVADPVILPASGDYTTVQTVKISDSTPGASIYYSAYGMVNTNGFVPYTGPIQLVNGGSETIQAYATETGSQQSNYVTANYTLTLPAAPAPVFSPAAGNYAGVQTVTISDAAPGATIYYTTNGAPPTTYATQYTGPIAVSSSVTLAAAAIAPGYSLSAPVSAQYLIGSSPTSLIYAVAGNGSYGYSGDGGPALLADLNAPSASVLDSAGNLYILDSGNNVVRKVSASTGVITTIVGNGTNGYSGDNGPATSAQLDYPTGFALDGQGNLYITDSSNNVVRKVAAATGVITTVAGNGTAGYSGDGGPATSAALYSPEAVALDSAGNLYIADTYNQVIRKVTASSGTIETIAGSQWGYSGDGGPATAAELRDPRGMALDGAGDLYIVDTGNQVIREVNAATGMISTVAGSGYGAGEYYGGYSGDGGPATSAELNMPEDVALDSSGNLYIADTYNQVIREVTATTGIISTVVGGAPGCYSLAGDGGPASSAALCYPQSVFVDHAGNLYIGSPNWGRIRLATALGLPPTVAAATPTFSVAAGTYAAPQTVTISDSTPGAAIYVTLDGSAPTTAGQGYNGPFNVSGSVTIRAIAVGPGYLTSAPVAAAYTISSPSPAVINTIAGSGVFGFSGSGGPATSAQVGSLAGVALDGTGNLYLADTTNNVVWEVAAKTGIASIVAGNGTPGYAGDGGAATSAMLYGPDSVAVDSAGDLYIADSYNNVIRKVTASTGLIATFAGDAQPGYSGDGGPAATAQLEGPNAVVLDKAGDLYISDAGNVRVRLVSASTGNITTVAGNGSYVFSGDGGLATSAGLTRPNALALDSAGNLYIASANGGRVREVLLSSGNIATVAGNGNYYGSSGDGGPAIAAEVYPQGLATDSAGNIYLSDWPAAVRVVSASTGIITRLAGNGYYGYSGDGGSATVASLYLPEGIALDASGNLYLADSSNYRVREVSTPTPTATPIISPASGTYTSIQMATITDSSNSAVIYYTTDGTTPTNTSNVYSGSIAISATTTLQAIAIAPGFGQSAVASTTYTIQLPVAPTVTATPSASSITTAQTLTVAVGVSGPSGSPTPTGSVTMSSGSYSATQNLANGTATFNLGAGALPVGTNMLTVTYTPDAAGAVYYTSGTQTATVTVTQAIGTAVATVTLTPSATAVTNEQPVSVAVSVAGASGQATPTGTVTLAGGSYSSQQPLSGGTATFSIPAGAVGEGANTLTGNYSGDLDYAAASGTTSVTVAPVVVTAPSTSPVAPGSSATATATFSAGSTYSGTMNLTCTLTASPAGAQSLPTCGLNPTSITLATGSTVSTVVTVTTTAASSGSALISPGRQVWKALSGGGVLALALLLGVPSRRRRKALMMVVLFEIVVAGIVGCGGGGSSSPTPPPSTPATTAGIYTFSVTGTDSSTAKITASTVVSVTVQ